MVRFYETIYPSNGNVVLTMVNLIKETASYVSLLEYDSAQGMLMLSEISRRRVRSINKLIKVGKKEILITQRVDLEKGYIDLSKRRISEKEIEIMERKIGAVKFFSSIFSKSRKEDSFNHEDFKIRFIWPCSRKFRSPIIGFKLFRKSQFSPLTVFDMEKLDFAEILKIIKKKQKITETSVEVVLEFICFSGKGFEYSKKKLLEMMDLEIFCNIKLDILTIPIFKLKVVGKKRRDSLKEILKALSLLVQINDSNKTILKIKKINIF